MVITTTKCKNEINSEGSAPVILALSHLAVRRKVRVSIVPGAHEDHPPQAADTRTQPLALACDETGQAICTRWPGPLHVHVDYHLLAAITLRCHTEIDRLPEF